VPVKKIIFAGNRDIHRTSYCVVAIRGVLFAEPRNEVIKGTQQNVSAGGTPHIAPIGYRNVREEVAGREARTVVVDEEHAPLVRWAFEAYATGDYTLTQLANELRVRGLTHRPTAQRAARAEQEQRRLSDRVATIRRERFKWAEKAMGGVLPDDIARERQQLLTEQLLAAESALSRLYFDQDNERPPCMPSSTWCAAAAAPTS
jgi:hypothetical protein